MGLRVRTTDSKCKVLSKFIAAKGRTRAHLTTPMPHHVPVAFCNTLNGGVTQWIIRRATWKHEDRLACCFSVLHDAFHLDVAVNVLVAQPLPELWERDLLCAVKSRVEPERRKLVGEVHKAEGADFQPRNHEGERGNGSVLGHLQLAALARGVRHPVNLGQ